LKSIWVDERTVLIKVFINRKRIFFKENFPEKIVVDIFKKVLNRFFFSTNFDFDETYLIALHQTS
jgi:hypothetical protein